MIGINKNCVIGNNVEKEKFEVPTIEVIKYKAEDIVNTSEPGLIQDEFGYGDDLQW